MNQYTKDESDLGALWEKQGAKGPYLTGEISGVKVICFPIESQNPKSPQWRVLKSKPRDEQPKAEADEFGF